VALGAAAVAVAGGRGMLQPMPDGGEGKNNLTGKSEVALDV
jgi:hypothetical protein